MCWMDHKVPHCLCMHFLMEQGRSLPHRRLQELVYEQWLHADLRDVVVQPCVPLCATQQQTCQITGQYIVQVFQYGQITWWSTSIPHQLFIVHYTYWMLITGIMLLWQTHFTVSKHTAGSLLRKSTHHIWQGLLTSLSDRQMIIFYVASHGFIISLFYRWIHWLM